MNYSVTAGTFAENDLSEAFEWYEEIRDGLGERFQEDFSHIANQLKENPFIYQSRYRNYRVAFMKIFP